MIKDKTYEAERTKHLNGKTFGKICLGYNWMLVCKAHKGEGLEKRKTLLVFVANYYKEREKFRQYLV